MVKMISVSELLFKALKEMKGQRSFTTVIEDLIQENAKFTEIKIDHERRLMELEKRLFNVHDNRPTA